MIVTVIVDTDTSRDCPPLRHFSLSWHCALDGKDTYPRAHSIHSTAMNCSNESFHVDSSYSPVHSFLLSLSLDSSWSSFFSPFAALPFFAASFSPLTPFVSCSLFCSFSACCCRFWILFSMRSWKAVMARIKLLR